MSARLRTVASRHPMASLLGLSQISSFCSLTSRHLYTLDNTTRPTFIPSATLTTLVDKDTKAQTTTDTKDRQKSFQTLAVPNHPMPLAPAWTVVSCPVLSEKVGARGDGDDVAVLCVLPTALEFHSLTLAAALRCNAKELNGMKSANELSVDDVVVNDSFRSFMHFIIAEQFGPFAEAKAKERGQADAEVMLLDGRILLKLQGADAATIEAELRAVPANGYEDLLGYGVVKDGKYVAGSYRAGDRHRLFSTRGLGFTMLDQDIIKEMRSRLEGLLLADADAATFASQSREFSPLLKNTPVVSVSPLIPPKKEI